MHISIGNCLSTYLLVLSKKLVHDTMTLDYDRKTAFFLSPDDIYQETWFLDDKTVSYMPVEWCCRNSLDTCTEDCTYIESEYM